MDAILSCGGQRRRGQSVLEYVVLLVIVTGVLSAMGIYIRRGVQGRIYAIDGQISPVANRAANATVQYFMF